MDKYRVYIRRSAQTLDVPDEYFGNVMAINLQDAETKAYKEIKKVMTVGYDFFYCVRESDYDDFIDNMPGRIRVY